MEINKRTRTELKQYFKINDKPTQEEFAFLIDASLNQAEDGIVKVQGDPLAIQAEGEEVGALGVIDVYKSFSDENPEWSINLNPRTDPAILTSNQPGFNIKDSTGQSKLFIKAGQGNVGVGTIEPTSKLTVVGKNTSSLLSAIDTTNEHATVFEVTQLGGKGMLSLRNNLNNTISQLSGDVETPNFFLGKMGVGTNAPKTNLHVSGKNAQLRITNSDQTIGTSANLSLENEGSSTRWEIGVEKGQDHLTFGTTNGGVNKIVMKNGGRLELSTLNVSESVDGSLFKASRAVIFGTTTGGHIQQDGALYRHGGIATLRVTDNFQILDTSSSSPKFRFNTKDNRLGIGTSSSPKAPLTIDGTGKEDYPDGAMHINSGVILFGGQNQGNHKDSGQISAGKHASNSLNIVGIGTEADNRKIDLWAEGGMNVRGMIKIPIQMVVAFSVSISTHGLSGTREPMIFEHTNYDLGNNFNNNQFTAPVLGIYQFTMTISKATTDTNKQCFWELKLNSTGYVNGGGTSSGETSERSMLRSRSGLDSCSRTVTTLLNAGDIIHIRQFGSGAPDNYTSGFEGVLLQALM